MIQKQVNYQIEYNMNFYSAFNPSKHIFLAMNHLKLSYKVFDDITIPSDKKGTTILFYLDVHKTFCRVPNERLLTELSTYEIANHLYAWIISSCSGRTQTFDKRNSTSFLHKAASGVI